MSGHKYVRMQDQRQAAADEAARREAEAAERARQEAMRRAAEAEAAARLAAARSAVDGEERKLAQLKQQAEGLGFTMDSISGGALRLEPMPAGADLTACRDQHVLLSRATSLASVCVAAATELPRGTQRAALVAALATAPSPGEAERRAGAWRGAAGEGGDTVQLAIRGREALVALANYALAGLRLTSDQERLRRVIEEFVAAPGLETRDDGSRALSGIDVPGLRRRLRNRQEHLLQAADRLVRQRREMLAEWRPTLPAELEQLPALISREEWQRVGELVAEVEAWCVERARLRLKTFLAAGASSGLRAGPIAFDPERKAVTSSFQDEHGRFAEVVHPASAWEEDELDQLAVSGPSNFTERQCMQSGIGSAVQELRRQGVPIDVFDERGAPVDVDPATSARQAEVPTPTRTLRRREEEGPLGS